MNKKNIYNIVAMFLVVIIIIAEYQLEPYKSLLIQLLPMHLGLLYMYAGRYAQDAWLADTIVAMSRHMAYSVYSRYHVFLGWLGIAIGGFLMVFSLIGPMPLTLPQELPWPAIPLAAAVWLGIVALILQLGLRLKR